MPGLPYTAASGAVSGRAMCRGSLGCRCAMQGLQAASGRAPLPCLPFTHEPCSGMWSGPGSAARGAVCMYPPRSQVRPFRLREELEGYMHGAAWFSRVA